MNPKQYHKEEDNIMANMTRIMDTERKNQTFKVSNMEQHINKFLNIQVKDTTRHNYEIAIKNFKEYLENNGVDELRNDNHKTIIQEYKSYLLNQGKLASSSIDNYILRIQSFYSYLNFHVKIKKLNSNRSSNYKYLTVAEIRQLLKAIPGVTNNETIIKRDKAIICLLFTGGLRINELINLKRDDFVKEGGNGFVQVTGKGRANDEKEMIAIPQSTTEYIWEYLETSPANAGDVCLFRSSTDKPLSRQAINKNLKRYARESDKMNNTDISERCSSHCFRHSLARHLLVDEKIPISQVKDILRHSNIETTAKYLTNSDDEIKEIRQSITF